MRIFGFQILTTKRHDAFVLLHRKTKTERDVALDDVSSLKRTVNQLEDKIERLEDKVSLVGVSGLINHVHQLQRELRDAKEMSRHELPNDDPAQLSLLQPALETAAERTARSNMGQHKDEKSGL